MENKGFTDEEIISTLQSLKDEGISSFNQSTVKASVFDKINKSEVKPVLMSFNKYINVFKPVLASLVVLFLGYGGLRLASSISPLSPLYVVKEKTDKFVLTILPENKKIEKKFNIANEKLAAIKQNNNSEKVNQISESVKKDLGEIADDIKNIKDPKKIIALSETLENQTENLQKETNLNIAVTTNGTLPSDIKETIKQTTEDILAVVYGAQDKSTNCSQYVQDRIASLTENPDLTFFNPTKYMEVLGLLKQAKNKLENGDCLGALADLDIVDSYKLNIVIQPTEEVTE